MPTDLKCLSVWRGSTRNKSNLLYIKKKLSVASYQIQSVKIHTDAERVAAPNTPAFFREPAGNLESIFSAEFLGEQESQTAE